MIKFSEQFQLSDLDKNAISSLTAKWLFDREHGSGMNRTVFKKAKVANDFLYLHYFSYPTYEKYNTTIDSRGNEARGRKYDTIFQFQNSTLALGDPATFRKFKPVERAALVRDYIENGLARVWCSCGAYYYQGMWEDMASHDSAIFPFPGPAGKGIWRARHAKGLMVPEIRICKHIASCIHRMDQDIAAIASNLSTKAILPSIFRRYR